MSGLTIQYSKELAKELTKIAVVLPGEPVKVGQIIHFPYGRKGIWPFKKAVPRGAFNVITSLKELGIKAAKTKVDKEPDPYIFSSKKSVKIDADLGVDGALPNNVNARLNIKFDKAGAVYFVAVGCTRTDLTDLQKIQVNLEKHKNDLVWNDTFLVTSVTVAKQALIMQSSTNSADLTLSGDIKSLLTTEISASSKISVSSFKESSFIKPWSPNVTVFIGLHRFTKKTFGFKPDTRGLSNSAPFTGLELQNMAGELVNSPDDKYVLEEVSAYDILGEQDFDDMMA